MKTRKRWKWEKRRRTDMRIKWKPRNDITQYNQTELNSTKCNRMKQCNGIGYIYQRNIPNIVQSVAFFTKNYLILAGRFKWTQMHTRNKRKKTTSSWNKMGIYWSWKKNVIEFICWLNVFLCYVLKTKREKKNLKKKLA